MLQEENISFAIKGAITRFQGFGDYIASSSSFEDNFEEITAISEIDKDFTTFYDSQISKYSELTQYFFFPKSIAQRNCFLAIRAKKKFTAFPDQYRFYDRREYYYFNLYSKIDTIDFSVSLPEMIQYNSKKLGLSVDFELKKTELQADEYLSKKIVYSLLNESTLAIRISKKDSHDIQNRILSSLNTLPNCLKKYIGFGFNIPSDSIFVNSHLHILTTLDENSILINSEFNQGLLNNELHDFAKSILSNSLKYDDTELKLLNIPLNRDALFELLKYHKLHFKIEKYLNSRLEELQENQKQNLLLESNRYIAVFLTSTFARNLYIQKRIINIYKFWQKNGYLESDIFISFWKKVSESNLEYEMMIDKEVRESINSFIQLEFRSIKSLGDADNRYSSLMQFPALNYPGVSLLDELKIEFYKQKESETTISLEEINELHSYIKSLSKKTKIDFQENLFRNYDFNSQAGYLSREDSFELLKDQHEHLNSNQIESIISRIGLSNLFDIIKEGSYQELIKNRDFNTSLLKLVRKHETINEILNWVTLLKENNVKLNFRTGDYLLEQLNKIKSQDDILLFNTLCRSIIDHRSHFKKTEVVQFIEEVTAKNICQNQLFYTAAFEVAKILSFKIRISISSKYTNDSIDLISLFNDNLNQISNSKIIDEIKEDFFNSFFQSNISVSDLLRLSSDNITFSIENSNKFSMKLAEIYSKSSDSEKYQHTLTLLNNILDSGKNLYLCSNGNLYKYISDLQLTEIDSVKEFYQIGERIAKLKNPNLVEVRLLINHLIDKYFESINQNAKFINKMKNHISFINRNIKITIICLIIGLVGSLAATGFFLHKNNKSEKRIGRIVKENSFLRSENYKLKLKLVSIMGKTKSDTIVSVQALSPLPNGELNSHDISIVNRSIHSGLTVNEVVQVVFNKNPSDIRSHYVNQTVAYASALVNANDSSFENGVYNGKPLTKIPAYK